MLQPEVALKHLHGLIKENASSSFLTYSRAGIAGAPQDIFCIDGNFAGANGISEMLLQSYKDEIFILPALPKSWNEGEFNGVCTQNGFILNFNWKNGTLSNLEVNLMKGMTCNLNYKGRKISFNTTQGQSIMLNENLEKVLP